MSHERVSHRGRVPVRAAATLTVGGRVLGVTTRNVGGEGAQVLLEVGADLDLAPGSRATLNVTLPFGAGSLDLEAEVRWVRADAADQRGRDCVAVGLTYRDVSPEARRVLERLEAQARPVLLAVGGLGAATLETLAVEFDLRVSPSAPEAWEALDREEIAVALLGPELRGAAAAAFLQGVKEQFPALATRFIVLAAGSDLSLFQDFVDDDTIFFLTESPVEPQELLAVVRSAVTSWLRLLQGEEAVRLESAQQLSNLRRILDVAQRLAVQNDMAAAAELAGDAARDLVTAERAYCLIYDPRDQVLRSKGPQGEERSESAAAGIVSFVARTGLPLRVSRAAQDSRYDRDADDPEGGGDERLLAVAVSEGSAGRVLAVIVAVRAGPRLEFAAEDAETLGLLARHVGSVLGRLALHVELERAAADAGTSLSRPATEIYREEALRHHGSAGERGDLLRLSGRWMSWSYRLIALSVVGGLVYLALGGVHEYAAGLAVVRLEGRVDVTATAAGTISRVDARPGQRVTTQQVLVALNDAQEAAELERVNREFDLQLVARLRDPTDQVSAQALASLRAQKVLAEARRQERLIRPPRDGIVSDVRVRIGQQLSLGDGVLTLVNEDVGGHVVALLPGHYLPRLRPGQPLWIELSGFPHATQRFAVESVADEVVGREEAQRYLGSRVSPEMLPPGPVVLVRARLNSASFQAQGHSYRFHDGMVGTAEVRVQSERLLVALIPGLKALLE